VGLDILYKCLNLRAIVLSKISQWLRKVGWKGAHCLIFVQSLIMWPRSRLFLYGLGPNSETELSMCKLEAVGRYRHDGRIKEAIYADTAIGLSRKHHKETG
jgi:hypothetical protein